MLGISSVRRIFERGGPENLRLMKTGMKTFQLKTKSVFIPKIRWRPPPKKKVFTQIWSGFWPKKGLRPPFLCSNLLPKLQRGGSMPKFCIVFYANYTILATQRGGHGPMAPLNYRRSQDFWLGGGPNHKSHTMKWSEIFKKRNFLWGKDIVEWKIWSCSLLALNQDFGKEKGRKLIVRKCKCPT